MTPKERLTKLLDGDEEKAQELLDNGVIAPPYKIGDKLYLDGLLTDCNPFEVVAITQEGDQLFIRVRDRYTFEDEYSLERLEKHICSAYSAEGA